MDTCFQRLCNGLCAMCKCLRETERDRGLDPWVLPSLFLCSSCHLHHTVFPEMYCTTVPCTIARLIAFSLCFSCLLCAKVVIEVLKIADIPDSALAFAWPWQRQRRKRLLLRSHVEKSFIYFSVSESRIDLCTPRSVRIWFYHHAWSEWHECFWEKNRVMC